MQLPMESNRGGRAPSCRRDRTRRGLRPNEGDAGPKWWLALVGLLGIGIDIATFMWPGARLKIFLIAQPRRFARPGVGRAGFRGFVERPERKVIIFSFSDVDAKPLTLRHYLRCIRRRSTAYDRNRRAPRPGFRATYPRPFNNYCADDSQTSSFANR